jgi:membrane protein YdbS with pleckstrin-like domain
MQSVLSCFRSHCLFKALNDRELTWLAGAAELLSAEPGRVLVRAGDRVEALYLVTGGETLTGADSRRGLSGDFRFATSLSGPVAPSEDWTAATTVKAVRITGRRFRFFLEKFPRAIKRLKPRIDRDGRLVSGLPESAWRPLFEIVRRKRAKKIRPVVHWSGRHSLVLAGIRLFIPVSAAVVLFSLASSGVPQSRFFIAGGITLSALSLFILVSRWFNLYRILEDSLEVKHFNLRDYSGTTIRIPFDQIQGSEVLINGLFSKAFGIGTVRIKTSAAGGTAEFRNIDRPLAVRNRILSLAADRRRENSDLDHADLRQAVEAHYGMLGGFTLVAGKTDRDLGLPEVTPVHESVTFRKSRFVLARSLAAPFFFFSMAAAGLIAFYLSGRMTIPVIALFPGAVMAGALGVALWRWIDWRNDLFMIDGGKVIDIDRKPFGKSESRKQIELASAQNILAGQQGFMAWLFDFGDVRVVTPGGSSDICFETVSHPAEVQRTLFRARELWLKARDKEGETRRIEEILAVTDEIRRLEPDPSP